MAGVGWCGWGGWCGWCNRNRFGGGSGGCRCCVTQSSCASVSCVTSVHTSPPIHTVLRSMRYLRYLQVCDLKLVSSVELTKTYHHLFPVPAFSEAVQAVAPDATAGRSLCFACRDVLPVVRRDGLSVQVTRNWFKSRLIPKA